MFSRIDEARVHAVSRIARAAPDGYTLLIVANGYDRALRAGVTRP